MHVTLSVQLVFSRDVLIQINYHKLFAILDYSA